MYVSHVLSKGSFSMFREDLRNFQLLCMQDHQTYEFGNRKAMKIYPESERISNMLKSEYYNVKH